jgi:hypothetical protein
MLFFYKLITLQERKNKRKKLCEAQMTMSVVWALWVHLFGSEPGGVDVTGVVAEAWSFLLTLIVLCGCIEGVDVLRHGCVVWWLGPLHIVVVVVCQHVVSLLGCDVGCDWEA